MATLQERRESQDHDRRDIVHQDTSDLEVTEHGDKDKSDKNVKIYDRKDNVHQDTPEPEVTTGMTDGARASSVIKRLQQETSALGRIAQMRCQQ